MGLEKLPFPLPLVIMYRTLCNCCELSNQYSASHQAYEIQVTSLTRSLAQMEEQLRLANEDRVSDDISLFKTRWLPDLTFRLACTFWVGHNLIHSHNLYTNNHNQRLGSTSDPGFWSRVKTLLLLRGALSKFHVIEDQNARDQITSDRLCKRAWSDFGKCIP